MFEKNYNVVKESEDFIYNVMLDAKNNIYVTGISIGKGTSFDFATIKYSNTVSIHQDLNYLPDEFNICQNYPNPFNPSTKISYSIPKQAFVKIIVYDIEGREIKKLVNEIKSGGNYYVSFEGSDFPAGVYFYRLDAEAFNMKEKWFC